MAKNKTRANGEGSIYQDKNGVWWAQRYLPGGGYLRRRSKTHAGAVEKMRELQQLKTRPRRELVVKHKQTVSDYVKRWLEERRDKIARKTYETYSWVLSSHVLPEIGSTELWSLRFANVKNMANKIGRKPGVGRNTVHSAVRVLHKVIVDAKREESYPPIDNPAQGIELPLEERRTQSKAYSEEEAATLVRYVMHANSPEREAILFAVYTGARNAEVRGIRWCDIGENKSGPYVRICGQIEKVEVGERKTRSGSIRKAYVLRHKPRTKSNRDRYVTLEPVLMQHLNQLKASQLEAGAYMPDGFVFLERPRYERSNYELLTKWRPITGEVLRKRLLELTALAGIDYKAFHSLRHTFVTLTLEEGTDAHATQKTVGHSHQSTTSDVYAAQTLRSSKTATSAMTEIIERNLEQPA